MNSCSVKKTGINFQRCCSRSESVLFIQTALFPMWLRNLTWHVKKKKKKSSMVWLQRVNPYTPVEVYSPCYFISLRRGKWQQRRCPSHEPDLISQWVSNWCRVLVSLCSLELQSKSEVQIFQFTGREKTYISSVNHSVTSRLFHVPTAEFPGPRFTEERIAAALERQDFENKHSVLTDCRSINLKN